MIAGSTESFMARSIPGPAGTNRNHSTNARKGSVSWLKTWRFPNSASESCQVHLSDRWGPQVHRPPKPIVLGETETNFTLLHADCRQGNSQVEVTDLGFLHSSPYVPSGTHPSSASLQSLIIILECEGQKHIVVVSLCSPRWVPQKLLAAGIWVILEGSFQDS